MRDLRNELKPLAQGLLTRHEPIARGLRKNVCYALQDSNMTDVIRMTGWWIFSVQFMASYLTGYV